jgi:hypothetical protein
MQLYYLIILIPVLIILVVALLFIIKARRGNVTQDLNISDVWSCACKVCKTRVAFDSQKPIPAVWRCPSCGSKNYSQPQEIPI